MHEASGLVASSPNLPPVGTLRFASLSSSHTNMVLKSFAIGQKHPDERLTMAGKLSPEKIHAVDESFYEAITQGITTIYIYIYMAFVMDSFFGTVNIRLQFPKFILFL